MAKTKKMRGCDVTMARRFAARSNGLPKGKTNQEICEALGLPCGGKRSASFALIEYWRSHGAKRLPRDSGFRAAASKVGADDFLRTYEWRRVRMQALKLHGARCQCCGATPATGAVMNVDHIKPRKLFPELALDLTNLQVLCDACNHGKGNWDMTDWREEAKA
jgi:hypothetical protein